MRTASFYRSCVRSRCLACEEGTEKSCEVAASCAAKTISAKKPVLGIQCRFSPAYVFRRIVPPQKGLLLYSLGGFVSTFHTLDNVRSITAILPLYFTQYIPCPLQLVTLYCPRCGTFSIVRAPSLTLGGTNGSSDPKITLQCFFETKQ